MKTRDLLHLPAVLFIAAITSCGPSYSVTRVVVRTGGVIPTPSGDYVVKSIGPDSATISPLSTDRMKYLTTLRENERHGPGNNVGIYLKSVNKTSSGEAEFSVLSLERPSLFVLPP